MTLFRFPRKAPPIREMNDRGDFAVAVQQAGCRTVDVVIQVTKDDPVHGGVRPLMVGEIPVRIRGRGAMLVPCAAEWYDVEVRRERWRPEFEGGVKLPEEAELATIARKYGARAARAGVRINPIHPQ